MYDSDGDSTVDTVTPPCAALSINPTSKLSAIDLGCVDTALAGVGSIAAATPCAGTAAMRLAVLLSLAALPLTATTGLSAVELGCVSLTTAGLTSPTLRP